MFDGTITRILTSDMAMSENEKEFIRHQLITFNSQQEVCDLLDITTAELLEAFEDKLLIYATGGDNA